jgi:hypothetical protein
MGRASRGASRSTGGAISRKPTNLLKSLNGKRLPMSSAIYDHFHDQIRGFHLQIKRGVEYKLFKKAFVLKIAGRKKIIRMAVKSIAAYGDIPDGEMLEKEKFKRYFLNLIEDYLNYPFEKPDLTKISERQFKRIAWPCYQELMKESCPQGIRLESYGTLSGEGGGDFYDDPLSMEVDSSSSETETETETETLSPETSAESSSCSESDAGLSSGSEREGRETPSEFFESTGNMLLSMGVLSSSLPALFPEALLSCEGDVGPLQGLPWTLEEVFSEEAGATCKV